MKDMHVLIICSSGYPDRDGAYTGSVFVERIVDELKSHVAQVSVIAPRPYIPRLFRWLPFAKAKGLAIKSYTKDNVSVYYPRYIRTRKAYPFARMTAAVMRAMQQHDISPDIVHAHYLLPSGPIGKDIAKEHKVPLVITGHGQDVYSVPYASATHSQQATDALLAADYISTVSEDNAAHIKKLAGLSAHIVYNGYDEAAFFAGDLITARESLGIPKDASVIVQAGRLEENKNQLATLSVCNSLREKGKDIHCYFIGQQPSTAYLQEMKEYVASHGLTDLVHIVGSVTQQQLGGYFRAADLSVIPSHREGNPTVLIESLACGTPVVGSDISGIRDMLDGKTGELFAVDNDAAYADTVDKWISKKPTLVSSIAKVVTPHSTKAIATQWKDIYLSLTK